MKEVYIISAVRTPMGSFGGSLKSFSATQLGAAAIKGALAKAGIEPALVNDVLMGCVIQANLGQAPARQAALFAGLPNEVNCTTVNKVCASGMKAIAQAAQSIMLGDADIVVAGGMESMSNVPFYSDTMRWGNKYGNTQLTDGLAKDGLTDVYDGKAMGNTAEFCAAICSISRQEQDAFTIESYKRSQAAIAAGKFDNEIVPVEIPQRKGDPVLFAKDEEPFNVKFEKIPELKGAFQKDGTVTAANSSTMNDGAAALVPYLRITERLARRTTALAASGPLSCRPAEGAVHPRADARPLRRSPRIAETTGHENCCVNEASSHRSVAR